MDLRMSFVLVVWIFMQFILKSSSRFEVGRCEFICRQDEFEEPVESTVEMCSR